MGNHKLNYGNDNNIIITMIIIIMITIMTMIIMMMIIIRIIIIIMILIIIIIIDFMSFLCFQFWNRAVGHNFRIEKLVSPDAFLREIESKCDNNNK